MRKNDSGAPATPTIQVIERMFALIDVLASREDAVSLKEISEKTGLHPSTTHRILNDLATGRFVDRPEAGPPPLHLPSTGKLFLAADDAQRVRAYATRTGLAGHTKNSITQLPLLERELAKARQYGIARDNEELELGVRCMAAGIYDDQARLVAGLSISAPADRLDENWLTKLQSTASQISAALGYRANMQAAT